MTPAQRVRKLQLLTLVRCTILLDAEDEALREFLYIRDDGYVVIYQDGKLKRLHRMLLGVNTGYDVDHINGNPLDNRKCNLRVATRSQNMANSTGKKSRFGYKGVYQVTGGYKASITVNYMQIHLGIFDTAEKAALAYNKAAIEYHGEFAKLNEVI